MLSGKQSRASTLLRSSSSTRSTSAPKASYASVRSVRHNDGGAEPDEVQRQQNEFIMSILRAKPSLRDSKSYLASFGAKPTQPKSPSQGTQPFTIEPFELSPVTSTPETTLKPRGPDLALSTSPVLASILDPVIRRTALVKIQGPFNERQLASIAQGMVHLEKLGLVSVVVVEDDEWEQGAPNERLAAVEHAIEVATALEKQGAKARPILDAVVRLGPKPGEENLDRALEAHALPQDLTSIKSALRAGEIPVLPPFAVDSFCRSVRVDSNRVLAALARGMVEAAEISNDQDSSQASSSQPPGIDLTPLRLMIINREGGIPSYARAGLPHLLVNLDSEHDYINDTFQHRWWSSNPSALSNLSLARSCLNYMPSTSSAIMVSHRSRSSLIANLITNKPAFSSSLPHALLQGAGDSKLTPDTPTLLRRGLPIRVVKHVRDIDKTKMTALLEKSFGRTLNENSFYDRLEKSLDFAIVAGDYVGAAIVTQEPDSPTSSLTYLDKFAVLPQHQGDGTVDFLWVALHDESYGLGLPYSVNPNGGNQGEGEGRDLVWRSRSNNPINKWYFERSSGHIRLGDWVMFWCDAEAKLKTQLKDRAASAGRSRARLSYIEKDEEGRMVRWSKTVASIPSAWM